MMKFSVICSCVLFCFLPGGGLHAEYLKASPVGSSADYPVLRFAVYKPPTHNLTKPQIEDHLNRIYKTQANVSFNVTVKPLEEM